MTKFHRVRFNRYEIRDIRLPARVQEAMQMQVEAEVIEMINVSKSYVYFSLET